VLEVPELVQLCKAGDVLDGQSDSIACCHLEEVLRADRSFEMDVKLDLGDG
jgi:hypothetical protein